MRVLITGAAGALGHDLVQAFAPDHDVVACDPARRSTLPTATPCSRCRRCPTRCHRPRGAWTDVDGCEADVDRAWAVNALGTRHVAEGGPRAGARLCYVSTDYVFDGTADRPYARVGRHRTRISVYGRSKRGGEVEALSLLGRRRHGRAHVVVVRPRGPQLREDHVGRAAAGRHRQRRRRPARLPHLHRGSGRDDPRTRGGAPARALPHHQPGRRRRGIDWRVTPTGLAGADPALVRPISTAALDPPRPAPRPPTSVLDNAALRLSGMTPAARAPRAPRAARQGVDPIESHRRHRHRLRRASPPAPASPTWATRSSAPTSSPRRSSACREATCRSSRPGSTTSSARVSTPGASPSCSAQEPAARDCEFAYLCVPDAPGRGRLGRPLLHPGGGRGDRPGAPRRSRSSSTSRRCRSARRGWSSRPSGATTCGSCRTPSSCARAPRCTTSSTPIAS